MADNKPTCFVIMPITTPDPESVTAQPSMDAVKIAEKPAALDWDYDAEADVLYLSVGASRPAIGVDIGEGVVLRYDPTAHEMVGLTVIGLRARLLRGLASAPEPEPVAVADKPRTSKKRAGR